MLVRNEEIESDSVDGIDEQSAIQLLEEKSEEYIEQNKVIHS
mgnify:FL=1